MERMTMLRLAWREVQSAKLNTLLCLFAVMVATGVLVAMVAVSRASVDATRIQMKEMGFNLLIVPDGMDLARYQALDFQDATMPEDYVGTLASNTGVMAQHFVGKYQKTVALDGCTAVLTGVLAEVVRHGTEKQPMPTAYDVPRDQVFLGAAVGKALARKPGDSVEILGRRFEVGRVLEESGVMPEDIRVYAHLRDVQELLGHPGRINAIDALACQCPGNTIDLIGALERSIQGILPGVTVQPYHSILLARHNQRVMVHRLGVAALALVIAASAAAIWGLTHQNVRNRRFEVGVLRALGVATGRIGALFLVKSAAYGLLGAMLGCGLGIAGAAWLNVTGRPVSLPPGMAPAVILLTPLAAVVFSLPPIAACLLQEPVDALGDGERS